MEAADGRTIYTTLRFDKLSGTVRAMLEEGQYRARSVAVSEHCYFRVPSG